MKNSKSDIYGVSFRSWVHQFLNGIYKDKSLDPAHKKLISVSAGVDSMALLHVLANSHSSLKKTIEVVHFNHGTRPLENAQEESLVRQICESLELKLHVFFFDLNLAEGNFEKKAREKRNEVYRTFIKEGFIIYLAHHVDDSFEWSLMQKFRQASTSKALGIPVINGQKIRPFMCVTKKQIYRYAKKENLLWREDSSNLNNHFERNYIRNEVVSKITARYPKALKNYVLEANQLAHQFNMHISDQKDSKLGLEIEIDRLGRYVLKSKNFFLHMDQLKSIIGKLSNKARGKIHGELSQFLKLQIALLEDPKVLSVKGPFRGPHEFSGGVKGFIYKDTLVLMSEQSYQDSLSLDEQLFDSLNSSQIPLRFKVRLFPYLKINNHKSFKESSKLIHALFPKTSQWLKRNNVCYSYGD